MYILHSLLLNLKILEYDSTSCPLNIFMRQITLHRDEHYQPKNAEKGFKASFLSGPLGNVIMCREYFSKKKKLKKTKQNKK